ncbi:MAG TPA: hypothetical protein VND64_13240 [Pirellulales bacterium]|nr:hypothetical protein [Pirellulales bacterium]
MPGIDYRALRAVVSLAQVLELLRFQPARRQARKVRGPCPIHDPNGKGERDWDLQAALPLLKINR